ncbi:hypothetical protein L1987_84191 [Smallanthus sonchifolius]|uniref:Uncharacterized protein n=1 Tax=Smallanthus sonchifolius TaxID=185202 RepID=A0ACB8YD88_9ASTR|nr:hypothetical protein L1987_84191 [Smallanthus sonchifolius]
MPLASGLIDLHYTTLVSSSIEANSISVLLKDDDNPCKKVSSIFFRPTILTVGTTSVRWCLVVDGRVPSAAVLFRRKMGRVRTKTVKKSSRQVIERYYSKMTLDFHTNKKILEEVAIIPSKRLRNKIAGFSTHLMKRIQKGPVRGISLKLQEEERERRMDFVPDESAIKIDHIEVDKETIELLASLGMSEFPGVVLKEETPMVSTAIPGAFGGGAGGRGRRY